MISFRYHIANVFRFTITTKENTKKVFIIHKKTYNEHRYRCFCKTEFAKQALRC